MSFLKDSNIGTGSIMTRKPCPVIPVALLILDTNFGRSVSFQGGVSEFLNLIAEWGSIDGVKLSGKLPWVRVVDSYANISRHRKHI